MKHWLEVKNPQVLRNRNVFLSLKSVEDEIMVEETSFGFAVHKPDSFLLDTFGRNQHILKPQKEPRTLTPKIKRKLVKMGYLSFKVFEGLLTGDAVGSVSPTSLVHFA